MDLQVHIFEGICREICYYKMFSMIQVRKLVFFYKILVYIIELEALYHWYNLGRRNNANFSQKECLIKPAIATGVPHIVFTAVT